MIAIENIKNDHGTEMAAIILCCRVFFGTATNSELKQFVSANNIDWYSLIRLARQHRIRPVIYPLLHRIDLPNDIKVLIYKQQAEITQLNWKQAIETERIIMLLKKHGVQAVPYKGTAFSKQFFGDLVSRESSDIDLIIQPADLSKAIDVLKLDAYLPELDEVYNYLGTKYHSYYKDYNLNKYKNGQREFHIELHWAIAETYLNVNDKVNAFIYETGEPVKLLKADVAVLTQNAHFASVLIHHTIKDTFKYLKNIVDISQALSIPGIKTYCDKLNIEFADIGLQKILAVSNELSEQLMGICLPKTEAAFSNVKAVKYFAKQLCGNRIMASETSSNILDWMHNRLLLQDSFLQRMKFYWISGIHRFIPASRDFELVKLPKSIFFVYYFMKPFRSIIKPFDTSERKRKLIPLSSIE
ncbi:nucleotidyltransferase family protein [Mucilaginibacter sp. HMF5004]|uniref:nucleotidyltransferase family protein n=1 Tax=Mucilaginibacter rivuli TaxID=2857527 RepID=UPI001C5E1F6B|nr:nucleotidyltransferase family protein [Mucilaginibacter rivuli]MBW4890014.1 nucleotidyltransferase family protein [Mucilaginibacter rivuli]